MLGCLNFIFIPKTEVSIRRKRIRLIKTDLLHTLWKSFPYVAEKSVLRQQQPTPTIWLFC